MVYFVGAGPGAEDLITLRGARLLAEADCVIYAGSLVNPALLTNCREGCRIFNSAEMCLEEVLGVIREMERNGLMTVRLHTGDPSLYGAIREQIDALRQAQIPFAICPGVSSFSGAAAALEIEYTLPDVSQSVIISRAEGRTPVPEKENLQSLAAHQATMVLFLSAGMLEGVQAKLIAGGYAPDTPAAVVYKASWPDEKIVRCMLSDLAESASAAGITHFALVVVGSALSGPYERSRLYDPGFSTAFRKAVQA